MKAGKIIGRVVLGALALSAIPYQFKKDEETGGFAVRSLLWAVKKTPGEEQDHYEIEVLPILGSCDKPEEEAEAPAEDPVEAPAAE